MRSSRLAAGRPPAARSSLPALALLPLASVLVAGCGSGGGGGDAPPAVSERACEVLNAAECLLPYPSSHFLVPDPSTATGFRLSLPQAGIPRPNGPEIPAALFDGRDGFSPGVQILMHFPQGVDPERSGASRLLGIGTGPPWVRTRTYDTRSLEADSPTVLLDATTGERILHFIEPDARADGPARQILFLRPARILAPNHRYVVAMRRLVAPDGSPVTAEPAFAALRDGTPSEIHGVEERRAEMEDVFRILADNGIERRDLVLAFDFRTASDEQLSGAMRSMRDQAYEWLREVEADPSAITFTSEITSENDCGVAGTVVWREVAGTFESPLFLTEDPSDDSVGVLNVDEAGRPMPNGLTHPDYTATIPCSVFDPSVVSRPVLFGHGLFQRGSFFTSVVPPTVAAVVPWTGIGAATDWRGLSGLDVGWVTQRIIGTQTSELHHYAAFADRLRQGMLNTLVLARMMKRGLFNRDPSFQRPDGSGVFPGPAEELSYYGVSLGGIMGTYLAGLTPDIERFALDVPAVNFSCLLQRALPFESFDALLRSIGLPDPLSQALVIQLTHELWSSAEPVSVVRHVRRDPLPGAGRDPKRILYAAAWLDKQVSNTCTEIAARTMGLPVLAGSIQQGLAQMEDVAGPVDSALTFWHLGELDITDPAHAPFLPPLANLIPSGVCDPHPRRALIPDAIRQLAGFLRPGGLIEGTCDGLCDGGEPEERPAGAACDPLG